MEEREEGAHRKWLIKSVGDEEANRKQRYRKEWLRDRLGEYARDSPKEFDVEDIHKMIELINDGKMDEITKRRILMYIEWIAEGNTSAFKEEHAKRIREIDKENLPEDLQRRLKKLCTSTKAKKE